ncbi:hypothetical protein [Campylobacter sp.]|uniref:hypothetical protein n=1 Tax=Campylobacter sp. TaxID=205 RepID=UPI002A81104F|nr:hypothetical protein [Campylobacter sp.]MDY4154764.1 hypothetical protein [Campylobacter sp.]
MLAALAVERRSGSVRKSFALVFGVYRTKTSESFCVRRWAVQKHFSKIHPQAESPIQIKEKR